MVLHGANIGLSTSQTNLKLESTSSFEWVEEDVDFEKHNRISDVSRSRDKHLSNIQAIGQDHSVRP